MCGIAGIFRSDDAIIDESLVDKALLRLTKRGPNAKGKYIRSTIALCHTRLAIIDPEPCSNQPFIDPSGRFVLVFNGEIFNYSFLKKTLIEQGQQFNTQSDTEVLLYLLIREGKDCLSKLNGFFAFAFYDTQSNQLLLARDRYGVKPLYIYENESCFAFASELKALEPFGISKALNYSSVFHYFQLNYIPSPRTIFEHINKLPQATWIEIKDGKVRSRGNYYQLTIKENNNNTYQSKQEELKRLLLDSVKARLVSDVPVGVFLSGGVDSSIVAYLAKQLQPDIRSFSIGFKDNAFFDESIYAEKVAKHIGIQHHTFMLNEAEVLENLSEMLNYVDEPFADSSAIAVYNLCKYTREHVTVALTGDGADEVFGGYNKHLAEWKIRQKHPLHSILSISYPFLNLLPSSRGGHWGNKSRKLQKYARSISLSKEERYWQWCCFSQEAEVHRLFSKSTKEKINREAINSQKHSILQPFTLTQSLNAITAADMGLVLEGDMLVKTDRMSMANSLELRNPFLDYRLVDFVFSLPDSDKMSHNTSKRILRDTFRDSLPTEVFSRPKHGFEVPLHKWLRNELKYLTEQYLSDDYLLEQSFFDPIEIKKLLRKLDSSYPGDVAQRIWGLIVFQHWHAKHGI